MRMIVLAVIALMVIGGGAGAYFIFMQPAEAALGETAKGEHDKKKSDKHAKNDGHGKILSEFVELSPLILPIVDDYGVSQTVSLVVAIEVPAGKGNHVRAMQPKLTDAYIQDMYGVLGEHAALKGGVIKVGMIKKRLNHISTRILGEDHVNDVLLQVVQQRPI